MKANILSVLMLCSLLVVSCEKDKGERKICTVSESSVSTDEKFQNNDEIDGYAPNFVGDRTIERTILSPLVRESSCNYIVSGKIKYTYIGSGETAAILDYGDGTVDAWAVKTIYTMTGNKNNCFITHCPTNAVKEEVSGCYKFEQKCNELTNTAISREAEVIDVRK